MVCRRLLLQHRLKCISDCQENTEEMTVERDSQNFTTDEEMDHKPPSLESKGEQGESPKREASISPVASSDIDNNANDRSLDKNDTTLSVPKVRLNTLLALDPALNSDAKDLKKIHEHFQQEEEILDTKEHILIRPPIPAIPPAIVEATSQGQLIFSCQPCGITFSKRSTFEAHQTYYCSHRKDSDGQASKTNSSTPGSSSGDNNSAGESLNKPSKTGKLYNCPHCSYGADKKLSLNRHMRMHQPSPSVAANPTASNGDDSSQNSDRYCYDCDIKFQTVNVYRAHKKHYCNSRRNEGQTTPKPDATPKATGGAISPQSSNRSETPNATANQPHENFLVLRTNPIMIIPYSLIQTGQFFQGPMSALAFGTVNSENTCFVAENGSLRPVATAIVPEVIKTPKPGPRPRTPVVTPAPVEKPAKPINNNNNEPKHIKKDVPKETTPLDLSLRKTPPSSKRRIDDDVEPLEVKDLSIESRNSMTPEQIVCAPSLPNSPSMSPSPKRRLLSPRNIAPTSANVSIESIPNIIPEQLSLPPIFPPELARNLEIAFKAAAANAAKQLEIPKPPITASTSAASPQIYVKQGSWKCKECNIVFCKYENYHAHKQHYCSARNQETELDGKSASLSPIITPNPTESAQVAYQQLICAACGIKYASLENLKAHQKHYCGKGAANVLDNQIAKERCIKCKSYHDLNQQCPAASHSSQNSYKCPVCDVISLTAADSKKHLETHGQVKAFKCNICGYRGSTLRGMKTHIRMQHFDKKTPDLNEEDHMSCILEDEDSDVSTSHYQQSSPPIAGQSPLVPPQMYFCELCKYSSPYKGNLIRHMKQHQSSPSISPDMVDDLEIRSHNGEKTLEDRVKIEPVATPPPQNHHPLIPQIKLEPDTDTHNETITASIAIGARAHTPADDSFQSSQNQYCEHCDINFKMMKSYIAHKEFYCKNRINHGSIVVDDNDNSRSSPATALQT